MPSFDNHSFCSSVFMRRAAAVVMMTCAGALGASAQQVAVPADQTVDTHTASPLLASISSRPMDLATLAGVNYSSSSSSVSDDGAVAAGPFTLTGSSDAALQPPPRRRYGRPRYNDSAHNSDGSSKWTGVAGVGFELPLGNTFHYYNTSWAFQVGAGRNFNKHFGVLFQFDYDHFGVNGQTITNQQNLYNYYNTLGSQPLISGLDANNHIWSFSLNPIYTFYQGDKTGAYVVAGVGFYHKVTNFTAPELGTYCDPYYGCYQYQANAVIDHYTSNAPGFNAGFGMTYKPSRFANERLFIEGRYVFVDNSQRTGVTISDSQATLNAYQGSNLFPQNSNRTTYIPIKVGIRF